MRPPHSNMIKFRVIFMTEAHSGKLHQIPLEKASFRSDFLHFCPYGQKILTICRSKLAENFSQESQTDYMLEQSTGSLPSVFKLSTSQALPKNGYLTE